jgi:FkbM family methyltransferase
MSLVKNVLIKASGNALVQKLLEKNVEVAQYLMGIGAGSGVHSSGERAIFELLRRASRPPYCVFDVGANKGQFLDLLLEHLGRSEFRVHCFEPGRETFRALAASHQGDPRVTLNNVALGRAKGEATLHYDEAGSGLASLTKRKLDHFGIEFAESETIQVETIDDYCATNAIDHIHVLKIDVEGHELDALAGAKRMFEAKAIDLVTFEFGGCNIDTRTFFQDFWYFFRDAGFSLFRITPSGYLRPLETYREIHEQFRTINFVAVQNR